MHGQPPPLSLEEAGRPALACQSSTASQTTGNLSALLSTNSSKLPKATLQMKNSSYSLSYCLPKVCSCSPEWNSRCRSCITTSHLAHWGKHAVCSAFACLMKDASARNQEHQRLTSQAKNCQRTCLGEYMRHVGTEFSRDDNTFPDLCLQAFMCQKSHGSRHATLSKHVMCRHGP